MYNPFESINNTEQKPVAPSYGATSYSSYDSQYPAERQAEPIQAEPIRTSYTWDPSGSGYTQQSPVQPAQQVQHVQHMQQNYMGYPMNGAPYYQRQKKKSGKKAGKFFLKALVVVLCCAVISLGSVGVFAALIQNGTINIQSSEETPTAAFTLYKQADKTAASTVVTTEAMTAQEAAAKIIPSVVCVQNYQIVQNNFFGFYYGSSEESSLSPAGEGSGIIISEDGYIVTNQHVVDGATSLKVVTSEGVTYEAELIGEDTQTDLAVIKIEAEGLTAAEFASSSDLKVADEVIAVGNPGGLQFNSSATFGRVSALNRQVTSSGTGYSMACIQTDAAINPGNSGGALVDMNGRVVGVNSSKIVATGYEGLGFAIPSDTVQPIVSDLMDYGYVKDRPWEGFTGQYVERLTASWYGMNPGYYVTKVTSREAEDAGLKRGDMITAIDDVQITSGSTIAAYIADKKPGDKVTLTVERYSNSGTAKGTIELTLAENKGSSSESYVGFN